MPDGDDPILGRVPGAPAASGGGDDDDERPAPGLTQLEQLRDELGDIPEEFIELEVPKRDGWFLRVGTKIRYDQLMAWRKQATDKNVLNELRMGAYTLANKNTAIVRRGDELTDGDGKILTFRSRAFKDLIGAKDAVDAVVLLYGNDFHVLNAANRLLFEAGYAEGIGSAEDDDDEGPTER